MATHPHSAPAPPADPSPGEPGEPGALARFSPATRAWFEGSFAAPTAAQAQAWAHVSQGRDTLVVAPTGSGKTLSAFLWVLDRLLTATRPDNPRRRCRVLYISPLKALTVDIERNLRSPLVGIGHAAARLGEDLTEVRVGIRSGDTPAADRRAFATRPPDILITTPESLFLLLTSRARDSLAGVEAVIVDEIHAVAGTKRGAHLALSLARLDALLPAPAQRIGLSATVRPVDEVARFLTGGSVAAIVRPPAEKRWDLSVVVPVPDLSDLGAPLEDLSGPAAGEPARTSIWPHVEDRLVDLVTAHRSTLVFANSRRLAERLTARINESWGRRLDAAPDTGPADASPGREAAGADPRARRPVATATRPPAEVMAQSGAAGGAPPVLARAHHGSVSKEQRADIEAALKSGQLPAVVATSSLELGIDMGAVDLVVQVESPPTVAGALQRVGRAGHQVGATSRGVFFPKYRGDLVQSAVVVERMRAGAIEETRVPANPLDVLAQQVVAMCALEDWTVDDVLALARRTAPFSGLTRPVLESVLDMLAGRYPAEEFAELRPRIVWDRVAGVLSGRPGAQRLAVISGGTIPDRGLFGVFLLGKGAGRRVGELDEEMVYESRVGDVFALGTSSWRIEEITHDQVLVTPAPGMPGRLPFWKGETLGRPAELGRAVGAFVREVGALPSARARERVLATGLDDWAADNLLAYLAEQTASTGEVPDDRTLVLERFRDELGDWRIVVHSPYGGHVHAPWALLVAARMRTRFGVDVQAMHGDDGIVVRVPDIELDSAEGLAADIAECVLLDPDEVRDAVTAELGGSALFASRFRECASRALLLPRRNPGRRQALWQQRQRAAQLLAVAARYPSFPIVLEAVRECVQDVFDVPGLIDLLRSVRARAVRVVEVETPTPSPFARSLLFGYVAQYLYEGDSPLAERRAAALSLDPELLAELLGADASALRDLLDPDAVIRTEAELQRLAPGRAARHIEDLADLVRRLGPLTAQDAAARTIPAARGQVAGMLAELESARRLIRVRIAAAERWAAAEDAGRLRDGLGVTMPPGVAQPFLEPVTDPLGDLAGRYARAHGPFTAAELAAWLGVGRAVTADVLRRLAAAGRLVAGELRPAGVAPSSGPPPPDPGPDYCDPDVLRTVRRRSLAALRAEVEPATARDLGRFLPAWQHVGSRLRGADGLARVIEQLAGVPLPVSALESLVLPARVRDYAPHLLDGLTSTGEVLWQGHAPLPGDGWVSLHLADGAPLTLHAPGEVDLGETHHAILAALDGGGAWHARGLVDRLGLVDAEVTRALWDLAWSGRVGNDGLAPVRALAGGRGPRRELPPSPRGHRPRRAALGHPRRRAAGVGEPVAGRWFLLPEPDPDPTVRAHATAEALLDRYGVLTRGAVTAEGVPGGFAVVYRVLAAAEEAGRVRRGYFVEGLGAAQFGTTGAIDRLRALARPIGGDPVAGARSQQTGDPDALALAATDPANPYGAALPWPNAHREGGHRPGRRPGSLVVLDDGDLVLYLERGGRTALTWSADAAVLARVAAALAALVTGARLPGLTVEHADGDQLLGSDHPLGAALAGAGFHLTPRGWRRR